MISSQVFGIVAKLGMKKQGELPHYRTRGVSPRGAVTASPFAIATQRGRCGYGGEPSSIPNRATIPFFWYTTDEHDVHA